MEKYERKCQYCKVTFLINKRTGVKWAEKTGRGKFCSKGCKHMSQKGLHNSPLTEFTQTKTKDEQKQHPRYRTGIWSYRKWKDIECYDCGSTRNLIVHHMDKNRKNNELDNLRTVCAKCHCNIYHPRVFKGNQYVRV